MDITFMQVNRIIVYRLDEIGDFVLNTPVLRALRYFYPDAHIGLVVKPELKNLAETCPYIDALYTYNPHAGGLLARPRLAWRRRRLARKLRGHDLALLPRWDADDAGALSLAALSRTPLRIGFSECVSERKRRENSGYNRYLTHVVDDCPKLKHEVEKNLHLLSQLDKNLNFGLSSSDSEGFAPQILAFADEMRGKTPRIKQEKTKDVIKRTEGEGAKLKVQLKREINDSLELWLTSEDRNKIILNKPTIALGVGASRPEKMWPLKNFATLSTQLQQKLGLECVVIGGPKERELGKQLGDNVRNLAGELSLRESAAVLEQCACYVGNDTGPKHLAAAMGTPVFEITNGAVSDRFCAWGVPHQEVGMVTSEECFQHMQQFYEAIVLDKDATAYATSVSDVLVKR